jgi:hypothetical protein
MHSQHHNNYSYKIIVKTIIIVLTYNISNTLCFIAYDCSGPRLNMTAFNTLNVDYCTSPIPKTIEKISMIKLLQKTETKTIKFQSCYIIADYLITRCSGLDDAQVVRNGFYSEVIQIGANSCKDTHNKMSYTFNHGNTVNNLKINETIYTSDIIKGSVNSQGDCEGEYFKTDRQEWENVIVQAKYKITLSDGIAIANSKENIIILPTGTRLKLSTGYGIDSHKGETTWDNYHETECTTNDYDTIYEGPATLITSKPSKNSMIETQYFVVASDKIAFALKHESHAFACHIPVIQTEHQRLLILKEHIYMDQFKIKPISTFNTDLMAYINTKFVYIENALESTITSMYLDLVSKQCHLERKTLMQKLSLASYSLSEFAYAMGEGPGFTALKSGEIVYLLKCKPVNVEIAKAQLCFQELPVIFNNQTLFMAPKTHTLQKYGTEIDCNDILPSAYLMEGEWISISPKYNQLSQEPQSLKPETTWTWTYKGPQYLMNSGLYSQDQINALQRHLLFPQEVDAAQSNLARQTMGYNVADQGLHLKPIIDEEIISRLVEQKLEKMWGWFVGFGNFISGLLGIFCAWKIVIICLNTTLNMSILYQTFGCSFKILAGIFSGITQYVMHRTHKKNQKDKLYSQTELSLIENERLLTNAVFARPIPPPRKTFPIIHDEHYQTPVRQNSV